jgi:hypothetical protein
MPELITVKAAPDFLRVALWERNPAHPGGEAFVAGDLVAQVALTAEVQTRLNTGILVQVVTEAKPAKPDEPVAGYDAMTAAQVLELLSTLNDEQRAVVLAYETANKARKTVLEALN